MEELEQIFKENPFAAQDPEEMEWILNWKTKKSGKWSPPQFSRLLMPLKMLTNMEPVDGLKFDINLGLTPKF